MRGLPSLQPGLCPRRFWPLLSLLFLFATNPGFGSQEKTSFELAHKLAESLEIPEVYGRDTGIGIVDDASVYLKIKTSLKKAEVDALEINEYHLKTIVFPVLERLAESSLSLRFEAFHLLVRLGDSSDFVITRLLKSLDKATLGPLSRHRSLSNDALSDLALFLDLKKVDIDTVCELIERAMQLKTGTEYFIRSATIDILATAQSLVVKHSLQLDEKYLEILGQSWLNLLKVTQRETPGNGHGPTRTQTRTLNLRQKTVLAAQQFENLAIHSTISSSTESIVSSISTLLRPPEQIPSQAIATSAMDRARLLIIEKLQSATEEQIADCLKAFGISPKKYFKALAKSRDEL